MSTYLTTRLRVGYWCAVGGYFGKIHGPDGCLNVSNGSLVTHGGGNVFVDVFFAMLLFRRPRVRSQKKAEDRFFIAHLHLPKRLLYPMRGRRLQRFRVCKKGDLRSRMQWPAKLLPMERN